MRRILGMMLCTMVIGLSSDAKAEDKKGTTVTIAGMKSTAPATWKEEQPSNTMRLTQFKLPKADGDKEDAELVVFFFKGGGSGTIEQNLERQEKKFDLGGKKKEDVVKVTKTAVGKFEATMQDITGDFLQKVAPFDPNSKVTKKENYRQLYVIFMDDKSEDSKGQYYFTVVGPAKTIESHKKEFEEFIKNFK